MKPVSPRTAQPLMAQPFMARPFMARPLMAWPLAVATALSVLATRAVTAQPTGPRVVASGDTYEGLTRAGIAVFRGIPYALPPVGARRWKPPEPRPPVRGTQSARDFGAACMQDDAETRWAAQIYATFGREAEMAKVDLRPSEDCLFLNVWTGAVGARAPLRPVMVWIHGGSNVMGSGRSAWYDGTPLAQRGMVVVTINYRLGLYGFLAHPALTAESPHGRRAITACSINSRPCAGSSATSRSSAAIRSA
jgi:para-nitrobenzyl esterase